jgi:Outer membrane protein beta-barrel domain
MDNFDNNINNNLEDKAWASMKVLLDKELPEVVTPTLSDIDEKEKKKRRFLFFYLFIFGLIGTGLGYYIYAQNKDFNKDKNHFKNSVSSVNKSEQNSISNDIILTKKEENLPLPQVGTEGVTSENNKLTQTNKSVNNLNNTNSVNSKNNTNLIENEKLQNIDNQVVIKENNIDFNSENNTQNKSIIEPNKPIGIIENDINSNIKSDISSVNLIQKNKEITKENNVVIEPKIVEKEEPYIPSIKSISSTDLIDILQPQPIYFDNKNELNKEDKLLKKLSKIGSKKWSYGLILGLNTEGSPKMLSAFGGVFFQRALSAKWSINTGLNYRILAKDVANVEYLQSALDVSKNINSSTVGALLKVNKAYLRNLHYLEIPTQINYHFSRKISFFSGVKIGFLVTQSVGTNSTDQPLFVTTPNYLSSFDPVIADKNYTSNDLGLSKWDLGLLGGVNYNFSKRLSTQARYDFGLTDIYKGNNVTVYNRFIGLNIAYRF